MEVTTDKFFKNYILFKNEQKKLLKPTKQKKIHELEQK